MGEALYIPEAGIKEPSLSFELRGCPDSSGTTL
jgi:hypothetical protein